MIVSNADIYTPEWIELVFENRNKAYGAYDLRKHYSKNLLKAFGITLLFFGGVSMVCLVVFKQQQVNAPVEFNNAPLKPSPNIINITAPANAHKGVGANRSHSIQHGNTYAGRTASSVGNNTIPVPVASVTAPAEKTPVVNMEGNTANQPAEASTAGRAIIDANTLKTTPQPLEGANEWAAFLKRTLVYPAEAHRAGIMGKVWLSFVVEKDGSINDIKVIKPAGYGFDEEAVRVLKMAPAWKPGFLNGQAVRVKFVLPVEFRITP